VDELVELELVYLACVESSEAVTDVVEELAQLCPVVAADEFSRGLALCPLGVLPPPVAVFSHAPNVRHRGSRPVLIPGGSTVGQRSRRRVDAGAEAVMDDDYQAYPWMSGPDERFTLALILDVGEVLARHGYPAPSGAVLVELTSGLFRALHARSF